MKSRSDSDTAQGAAWPLITSPESRTMMAFGSYLPQHPLFAFINGDSPGLDGPGRQSFSSDPISESGFALD